MPHFDPEEVKPRRNNCKKIRKWQLKSSEFGVFFVVILKLQKTQLKTLVKIVKLTPQHF
jgi:hypothetical protein